MTNSFKIKLGQGGFGSVYKGELRNQQLVAVKVLSEVKGDGEDFINEVASVGRTSHINIVSLMGFCLEGRKRALIYEFMPNGSLERFIYSHGSLMSGHIGWEKLYQIAVGIARGLDYLHRGCSTRILHFDIKPHNILLDNDFCPKIADFGLAKLFRDKESKISMSHMRGTPGYIAPELFSRNFGEVSHKSDVYSYGMMILEMVGGRRNIKAGVDHTSEIYFPHWIYKKVELHEEQLGLHQIVCDEENRIARKMIIVGLWCLQTNPLNRPTITRVLEMLEEDLASLEIPPKPYLSSPPRSLGSPCANSLHPYCSSTETLNVVLRNVEGVMSICDRWTDVVRDVPIQATYLLYFKVEDEFTFRLDVYNANGCCILSMLPPTHADEDISQGHYGPHLGGKNLPEVKIEPDQSGDEDFMEIDGLDTQNQVPKPTPVQPPPHSQFHKVVVAREKFTLSKLAGFYNNKMLNLVYEDEDGELYELHSEWNMGYTRGCKIWITLFQEYAERLIDYIKSHPVDTEVVIIVQFAMFRVYRNRHPVSNYFEQSKLFINSDFDEFAAFKQSYNENEGDVPSSSVSRLASSVSYSLENDFLVDTKFNQIAELNVITSVKKVVILGTLKCLMEGTEWWYRSCKLCNKAIERFLKADATITSDDIWYYEHKLPGKCENEKFEPTIKFMMLIKVQDGTGSVILTLFDKEVRRLLRVTAAELVSRIVEQGKPPVEIESLFGKRLAIKIDISSLNIEHEYIYFTIEKLTEKDSIISALDEKHNKDQSINFSSQVYGSIETDVNKALISLSPTMFNISFLRSFNHRMPPLYFVSLQDSKDTLDPDKQGTSKSFDKDDKPFKCLIHEDEDVTDLSGLCGDTMIAADLSDVKSQNRGDSKGK
ncbi:hypothetical protein SSX86_031796, partial [Deinandra increscens subsp. villosa]